MLSSKKKEKEKFNNVLDRKNYNIFTVFAVYENIWNK